MNKEMKRAVRRHHAARLRKARRFYWGQDMLHKPSALGQCLHTPAICSCGGCGNPRKYFGDRTIQEQRAMQAVDAA